MPTPPTPNAITVVYDPSGTLVGNNIKNEVVFPITQCAIFPKQGAFYQNGFTVTAIRLSDNVTVPLVPNVDFEWSPPYSKQIDVIGAIVYSYILLKDVSLWSSATINYQAVGCENDAILLQQIVDLGSFDRLDLNSWKSLEGDYVVSADTVRPDIFNNGRTIFLLSRLLGSISRTTLSPAVIFNDLMDRVDSVANDLGFVQSKVDSLNASYVPPDLSGYVLKSSIPTQAVAEAGTDTTPRAWSSLGVAQNATAVFNKLIVAVNALIETNRAVLDAKINTAVSTLNSKIDNAVATLNTTITNNYNTTYDRATSLYQTLFDRDATLYNDLVSRDNVIRTEIYNSFAAVGYPAGGIKYLYGGWCLQWIQTPYITYLDGQVTIWFNLAFISPPLAWCTGGVISNVDASLGLDQEYFPYPNSGIYIATTGNHSLEGWVFLLGRVS
jgi:hypothetical protein